MWHHYFKKQRESPVQPCYEPQIISPSSDPDYGLARGERNQTLCVCMCVCSGQGQGWHRENYQSNFLRESFPYFPCFMLQLRL